MITAIDVDKAVFVEDSIPQALDHAKRIAKQNDLICVTGSLFTVGEARGYILHTKLLIFSLQLYFLKNHAEVVHHLCL